MKHKGIVVIVTAVILLATAQEVKGADSSEFEYLTRCVQAEAGNQDMKGKRLVAAVILNRVEDERFPDTITEVINAPKQFSVVANGTIDTVTVEPETVEACQLEMEQRTDSDIRYFNNCSKVSGTLAYKWGKHWFAK